MDDPTVEIYEKVGGDAPFYALVEAFYQGIENEPLIRPMYPKDMTDAKKHLALFLIQRFGGHTQYGDQRGHPRLRMRHVPFTIGEAEKEAWMTHMMAGVDATPEFAPFRQVMLDYFESSAAFLVNKNEVPTVRPNP
ncbi:MAG: globin [Capsulimonas sp.]|jgi:hemoglobin|nr:globin [Capsulimonas sp.]